MKNIHFRQMRLIVLLLVVAQPLSGCATVYSPYRGVNPQNPQFERGMPFAPLDFFGDLISKLHQLLLWSRGYGNHNVSPAVETELAAFLNEYDLKDVKVRINQWAPHKELWRLIKNPNIAWPYKILFFPSTLIVSLIARPFSGLLISDYYDPGSNTINIFSNEKAIAIHEAGHAKDFASKKYKGTYGLLRMIPGIDIFQEAAASDIAFFYFEDKEEYEDLLRAYEVLYPAYTTYAASYISSSPFILVGCLTFGHIIGRGIERDKRYELEDAGKLQKYTI